PLYGLSDTSHHSFGLATPTAEAIAALDPDVDKGWVVVRHHATPERADAYIDCVADHRPLPYVPDGPMRWQTAEGIFTLLHRPGLVDRPDHLLIFVTKWPVAEGPLAGLLVDVHHIV